MKKVLTFVLVFISVMISNIAIANAEDISNDQVSYELVNIVLPDELIANTVETALQILIEDTNKENIITEYNKEEMELLARLIEAEAKGESYEGKVAVGNVVINRVRSELFPNTIKDVIYAQNQFSPVKNGAINNTPSDDSINAAYECIYTYREESKEALYF